MGAVRVDEAFRPFAQAPASIEVPGSEGDVEPLDVALGARARVVELSRSLLGHQHIEVGGKRFGNDCTGFVRAVYSALGIDLLREGKSSDNGVTALYRFTSRHGRLYAGGRPVPGDLVFFRETYDLNGDGAANDGLTHVGIVDDVEADGTVSVIHRVARGVVRYRMNLAFPKRAKDASGRTMNDGLRLAGPGAGVKLAGELFYSYGTLLPNERLAAVQSPQ